MSPWLAIFIMLSGFISAVVAHEYIPHRCRLYGPHHPAAQKDRDRG